MFYLWRCCFQNKILLIFGKIAIHTMVELFIEQIYPTFVGHSKTLEQGTTYLVDITDYDSRKIDVLEMEK